MVEEDVGKVKGMDVDKLKAEVGDSIGETGLPVSGVDAASVASRSVVGVDANPFMLQASSVNKNPLHK
jgi:hypothetical protein